MLTRRDFFGLAAGALGAALLPFAGLLRTPKDPQVEAIPFGDPAKPWGVEYWLDGEFVRVKLFADRISDDFNEHLRKEHALRPPLGVEEFLYGEGFRRPPLTDTERSEALLAIAAKSSAVKPPDTLTMGIDVARGDSVTIGQMWYVDENGKPCRKDRLVTTRRM
jgi:hypothetical protein